MAVTALKLSYTTTDGSVFTEQKDAVKHQRRLDATAEFASGLQTQFGLDETVSINVAAYVAQNLELVFRMLGKVYRSPKDGAAAEDAGEAAAEGSDAQ